MQYVESMILPQERSIAVIELSKILKLVHNQVADGTRPAEGDLTTTISFYAYVYLSLLDKM